jgi:hypothetical protein
MTGDDENYHDADAMTWAGQHYVPKADRGKAQLEWDFSDISDVEDTKEVYRVPVPTAAEVNEQKLAEALFNATKRAEQAANQQAKLEGALQRIRGICNEVLGHEWYPSFPR